ncbi:hydrolase [Pseudidiomarina halophila]|uniref:Hydrolase n=1 Tax=Pseudidiomarina halophila TaxID=1449799 RepID=A0A432XVE9_9GAMM|nr:hydrolase [Pseudidiomarina halophila]RUO52707.1 hydrolase [Pseudidiomarina halophila]
MLLNAADSVVVIVDVQEKLAPVVHQYDHLIARMRWLGEIANELNVSIVVTEQYPKGLGISVDDLSAVIENAHVIEKLHFSAWQESNFTDVLQQQEKRQVVLMGMEAHVCILQTAIDLKQAGYEVFVVADAVGSRRDSDKQAALARLRQLDVQIVTSEMVAYEWMHRSGTDTFRHITKNWIRG